MSIDRDLDNRIKRRKLEDLEHLWQLLTEYQPSEQTNPEQAKCFEMNINFVQSEKERIESGVW